MRVAVLMEAKSRKCCTEFGYFSENGGRATSGVIIKKQKFMLGKLLEACVWSASDPSNSM